jgi:hypothetical protein
MGNANSSNVVEGIVESNDFDSGAGDEIYDGLEVKDLVFNNNESKGMKLLDEGVIAGYLQKRGTGKPPFYVQRWNERFIIIDCNVGVLTYYKEIKG